MVGLVGDKPSFEPSPRRPQRFFHPGNPGRTTTTGRCKRHTLGQCGTQRDFQLGFFWGFHWGWQMPSFWWDFNGFQWISSITKSVGDYYDDFSHCCLKWSTSPKSNGSTVSNTCAEWQLSNVIHLIHQMDTRLIDTYWTSRMRHDSSRPGRVCNYCVSVG